MTPECSICKNPKALFACGICQAAVCKKCVAKVTKDAFFYMHPIPAELSHQAYCTYCYNNKVADELDEYARVLKRAKDVIVFMKSKSEETRLMRRKEKPIEIKDQRDKDELLLMLAYAAAKAGFNTLVDVEINSVKIQEKGYEHLMWSGVAVPINVAEDVLKALEKRHV